MTSEDRLQRMEGGELSHEIRLGIIHLGRLQNFGIFEPLPLRPHSVLYVRKIDNFYTFPIPEQTSFAHGSIAAK